MRCYCFCPDFRRRFYSNFLMINRDLINFIEENFPRKKGDEVAAVLGFLNNNEIIFELNQKNFEIFPEEPADIWVKDINKKFQVVCSNFALFEGLGKAKPDIYGIKRYEESGSREDVFHRFVLEPLRKKDKYGMSAKGIILLIRPPFDPPTPWIEEDIGKMKTFKQPYNLASLGFDEIYLVLKTKNIRIYP